MSHIQRYDVALPVFERELYLCSAKVPVYRRRCEAERCEATKLTGTPSNGPEEGTAHEWTHAELTRRRQTEEPARWVRPHVVTTTSTYSLSLRRELKPRVAPVPQRLARVHISDDPREPPPNEASEESVSPLAAGRKAPWKGNRVRREHERLRLECAGHHKVSAG